MRNGAQEAGQAVRVSCLMPVWNGERFLAEALNSVLCQTYREFELVAVDDGSTDATRSILREYAKRDRRVRVFEREHEGLARALNFGLAQCRGEFVARVDADDICLPHRFAYQVDYLDRHPTCVIVGGIFQWIDENGAKGRAGRGGHPRKITRFDTFPIRAATTHHPLATIRRRALVAIGGYREAFAAEDHDMLLRIARFGSIDNPEELLVYYRNHGASYSVRNLFRQEEGAALAEVSAILVHRGEADPADETGLDEAALRRKLLGRFPAWLFEPYVEFRVWRHLRLIDPAAARKRLWRVIAYALSLRPATLLSRSYWKLRVRIGGHLALITVDKCSRALRAAAVWPAPF
jgi:glycosyltransferase involved in cell wall biosynthesis